MFVRDAGQQPRQIFSAEEGLHAHFPVWSPDQSFIYFVLGAFPQGVGPDRTDIWRIPPSGGTPERITNHNARVSHPVFLNARTLLYLASEPDGTGPFLYSVDVLAPYTETRKLRHRALHVARGKRRRQPAGRDQVESQRHAVAHPAA